MLPNLSITKHDFNLECKQTWSGNKVHTYTRVNEGVGGIREAQTIKGLIDGFRSWECRNRHQIDLLYNLNLSNPKKVHSKKEKSMLTTCESKVAWNWSKQLSHMALNRVLILLNCRSRRELSESSGTIYLQARSKFRRSLFASMAYISLWGD